MFLLCLNKMYVVLVCMGRNGNREDDSKKTNMSGWRGVGGRLDDFLQIFFSTGEGVGGVVNAAQRIRATVSVFFLM